MKYISIENYFNLGVDKVIPIDYNINVIRKEKENEFSRKDSKSI